MIEKVEVFLGEKKLKPSELKNYICINDYISEIVNEVYYKNYPEKRHIR